MCIAAAPAPWPTERFVEWPRERGADNVVAAGLSVRVAPGVCGEGRRDADNCWKGQRYLVVTVSAPGALPLRIESPAGAGHWIGIGTLPGAPGDAAAIVLTDAGGSGGCADIAIVARTGSGLRRLHLGTGGDTLCAIDDPARFPWPADRAGRGRPEVVLRDARFQCVFASCAASWYPPRILVPGPDRGTDVSGDPAFAPLFAADMARARAVCLRRAEEPAAPCAAYAADAARLGRWPEAQRVIAAQVARGCRVAADPCPAINRLPADFAAKVAAFVVPYRAAIRRAK